ncbi:hypothetical protein EVAR_75476_1 [Eumeta japonica]|uniref:Uncharacterized protein n=1 Tax=Eumeta variegata TaxID=151549 RepID=A0A4C1TMM2_EUMVA|nr:hypothetical protein EVAR_75476_1 [Eumeta japonica]
MIGSTECQYAGGKRSASAGTGLRCLRACVSSYRVHLIAREFKQSNSKVIDATDAHSQLGTAYRHFRKEWNISDGRRSGSPELFGSGRVV